MSEEQQTRGTPINVVRFGIGKEIQLYPDELVVRGAEDGKETCLPLKSIERLILTPGDPNPSKLILMADMNDDSTVFLAEGMTNARDFRAMLPILRELHPGIQFDPSDMEEQLRQAMNNRRACAITFYGAFMLICLVLIALYFIVAYIGGHH